MCEWCGKNIGYLCIIPKSYYILRITYAWHFQRRHYTKIITFRRVVVAVCMGPFYRVTQFSTNLRYILFKKSTIGETTSHLSRTLYESDKRTNALAGACRALKSETNAIRSNLIKLYRMVWVFWRSQLGEMKLIIFE